MEDGGWSPPAVWEACPARCRQHWKSDMILAVSCLLAPGTGEVLRVPGLPHQVCHTAASLHTQGGVSWTASLSPSPPPAHLGSSLPFPWLQQPPLQLPWPGWPQPAEPSSPVTTADTSNSKQQMTNHIYASVTTAETSWLTSTAPVTTSNPNWLTTPAPVTTADTSWLSNYVPGATEVKPVVSRTCLCL